jgi:hypothetical protein
VVAFFLCWVLGGFSWWRSERARRRELYGWDEGGRRQHERNEGRRERGMEEFGYGRLDMDALGRMMAEEREERRLAQEMRRMGMA